MEVKEWTEAKLKEKKLSDVNEGDKENKRKQNGENEGK